MKKNLLLFISLIMSVSLFAQITGGTYLIDDTCTSPNYVSLTTALTDLNANGLSAADDGGVVFEICEDQTETETGGYGWTITSITNASVTNQVTLRPYSGEDPILHVNMTGIDKVGSRSFAKEH